jgi:hypothetical protein
MCLNLQKKPCTILESIDKIVTVRDSLGASCQKCAADDGQSIFHDANSKKCSTSDFYSRKIEQLLANQGEKGSTEQIVAWR